ncbi:MAG: uncharacterized protein QG657_798 [Acidobacteriota bacterium]|nr:uncharacterized protein [Acidobacteriota bacterium]
MICKNYPTDDENVALTSRDLANLHCIVRDNRYFLFEKDSLASIEINQEMRDAVNKIKKEKSIESYNDPIKSNEVPIWKYVRILTELKRLKLFFPEKNNSFNLKLKPREQLTVFIQSSYRCNLKCRYCLADYKKQQGDRQIPRSDYKKSIDFVFSEYSNRKHLLFNFFGGEPLLEFELIRELVPYIQDYSRETKIPVSFAINTNGTLLNCEKLEFFKKNNFYIGFSIDGPEAVHNTNRPLSIEGSSFQQLMDGINLAKKYYPITRLKASSIFDGHSLNISRTLDFTSQLGIPQVTIAKAKLSPDESGYIKPSMLPLLLGEQEKIGRKILDDIKNRKMNCYIIPFHGILSLILSQKSVPIRNCEAGENQVTISGDGYIYPCYWMDGKHCHAIGSIRSGIDKQKKQGWLQYIEKEEKKCLTCMAENICGHGCHITRIFFNERDEVHCRLMRHRVEICIWINKSINNEDIDYVVKQCELLLRQGD